MEWLQETWRYIQEDKKTEYKMRALIAPLGRTPMDRKSGQSMERYSKRLERMFDDMTPWDKNSKFNAMRDRFSKIRGDEEDTQVVVMLGAGDNPDDPLYQGAVAGKPDKRKK